MDSGIRRRLKLTPTPRCTRLGRRLQAVASLGAIAWCVSAAIAAEAPPPSPYALEVVHVLAYREQVDQTALKLMAKPMDTPRSVTIIDSGRVREQGFKRIQDTLAYVPGMFAFGVNEDTYRFYSRGFNMGPDDTRFDGFSGYAIDMTQSPSLFGIEQAVLLRGPAGLLYGASALPGGVINLVGKKPQAAPFTHVDFSYQTYAGGGVALGSHAGEGMEIDTNGLLTPQGEITYRLNAMLDNRAFFTDGITDRHRGVLGAATWKFGAERRFSLTALFQYQAQPFAYGRGFVISPSTSRVTNDGLTGPINTNDLSPISNNLSGGLRTLFQRTAGIDFTAQLATNWVTKISYRYFSANARQDQFVLQPGTLRQLDVGDSFSWVIDRRQTARETDRRNHGFDWQSTYEFAPVPGVKNLTQFGFNGRIYQTTAERSAPMQPNQSPFNIYSGVALSPLVDAHPVLIDSFLTDDFYWNAYAQNQTSFKDRWILTLSLGYGEQEFGRDYPASLIPPANLDKLTATRKGEVTPNAGLLYHLSPSIALYGSFATSYSPAPGESEDINGQTGNFRPVTGRSFEVGAKCETRDKQFSTSISVYDTRLEDVLVQSDPTQLNSKGNRYFIQTGGGRRARGIEWSARGQIVPAWNLELTGSYIDARYRGEGRIVGSRMERTPPWSFSLYNRFGFFRGRLTANVGAIWQDIRLSTARTPAAPDPLVMPAYARVDAGLIYHLGESWEAAASIENALDRRYFLTGATGAALEVGAPRTVSFRISYRQ